MNGKRFCQTEIMTPYDFNLLCSNKDTEAACHAVFDQAHDKWTEHGRASLTEGEITVLCVETFFGETCNGGLFQYLWNESGMLAQYASAALRRVGLEKYAAIADQTLARCVVTTEEDEDHPDKIITRHELPGEVNDDDEPFADLEGMFFALYFADKQEFRRKMLAYILSNESQFVYPD
jgi:hypothetical protein